jgi:hypothetical protein
MTTAGAPARTVRAPAGAEGVPRRPSAAATPAPLIQFGDPAGQDRTIRLQALPDDLETKLIQTAEPTQVREGEGSVRHVEVFRTGGVRTPIIGRPRPLPGQRHARPTTPSFANKPDIMHFFNPYDDKDPRDYPSELPTDAVVEERYRLPRELRRVSAGSGPRRPRMVDRSGEIFRAPHEAIDPSSTRRGQKMDHPSHRHLEGVLVSMQTIWARSCARLSRRHTCGH